MKLIYQYLCWDRKVLTVSYIKKAQTKSLKVCFHSTSVKSFTWSDFKGHSQQVAKATIFLFLQHDDDVMIMKIESNYFLTMVRGLSTFYITLLIFLCRRLSYFLLNCQGLFCSRDLYVHMYKKICPITFMNLLTFYISFLKQFFLFFYISF